LAKDGGFSWRRRFAGGFSDLRALQKRRRDAGATKHRRDFRSIRQYAKIASVSLLKISAAEIPAFRRGMLSWFAERKRDLPWRRTRDPYRIWLSEVMLQQTRVAAVIPYYERFLKIFPDVRALARAKTDRVLAHWAGLGYYSRARNLQRAAKEIVSRHAGQFPREYEAALALPGIGRYTAAAVLSIAFGELHAVLDGNVARVLARIGALHGDLRAPGLWRKLEATAQDLLARNASGDWNQAMMELGATVCTLKSPHCGECPAEKWCLARKLGIAEELPSPRKKRATVHVTLAAAVLLDPRGHTLLVRQLDGDGALFSRMWQFPALETTGDDAGAVLAAHVREKFGVARKGRLTPLAPARHAVTFRNIRLEPYLLRVARLPRTTGARIVALSHIRRLPISNATKKIAASAIAHGEKDRLAAQSGNV
jgi:A/G-specific adenine glycosylase